MPSNQSPDQLLNLASVSKTLKAVLRPRGFNGENKCGYNQKQGSTQQQTQGSDGSEALDQSSDALYDAAA
jgi:hypothetical protein